MLKNISKIYQHTAIIILAIIISGVLNICLFAFQARAIQPAQSPRLNFAYDNSCNCLTELMPEPSQTIGYPSAPMPECCLTQNRNFNSVVNTANNKSAPTFFGLIISPSNSQTTENNFTYNTSQNIYPPPATLALATTVIRE